MNTELTGKRALVTGAASGIGRAIALAFARRLIEGGGTVVLGDRNEAVRSEVERELGDAGRYMTGDVTDDSYLDRLVATAVDDFGRLDIVVSAPAIFDDDGYETSWELWHRALVASFVSATPPDPFDSRSSGCRPVYSHY